MSATSASHVASRGARARSAYMAPHRCAIVITCAKKMGSQHDNLNILSGTHAGRRVLRCTHLCLGGGAADIVTRLGRVFDAHALTMRRNKGDGHMRVVCTPAQPSANKKNTIAHFRVSASECKTSADTQST